MFDKDGNGFISAAEVRGKGTWEVMYFEACGQLTTNFQHV